MLAYGRQGWFLYVLFGHETGEYRILCKKNLILPSVRTGHYPKKKMQRVRPKQILIPHRSFSDKRLTGNGFRQRDNRAEKCNFRGTGMRKQPIPTFLFSRKNRNRNGSNRCNSNPSGSFQIKDKTENGFGNEITERKARLSRNWNAKATTSNLSFSQKNGNATGSTEAIPFPHRSFSESD